MPFLSLLKRILPRPSRLRMEAVERFVASSRDVLCQIDAQQRIQWVSPAAAEVFGRSPEEMVGMAPEDLVLVHDLPILKDIAARRAAGDLETPTTTVRVVRPNGVIVWVESTGRTVIDPVTGRPGETLLIMRDVSERKARETHLEEAALTDGLTGLCNRRAFDENLAREWGRAQRDDAPLSLILIDVDHFKGFNDHHGHQAGDECLRRVAGAVVSSIRRPGDRAARYGGEELAVVLPGADAAGAGQMAEQIRSTIEAASIGHPGSPCGVVTASLGVATVGPGAAEAVGSPEGLIEAADAALYRAKRNGRNRVETARVLTPVRDTRAA